MSSRAKVSPAPPRAQAGKNILTAAKGGGIVFAGNMFQNAGRLVTGVLLARLLGAEQLGLCNLALTAASIASGIASLGLAPAMVRYVALYAGRKDRDGLWGTLQVGLGLTTVLSVLAGLGLFFLAKPIAEQAFHSARLTPLLQVISLVVPFLTLSAVMAAATRGFKKMHYTVISQSIAQPASRLLITLGLAVLVGLNAKRALAAFDVAVMIVTAMLLYFLNRLFPLTQSLRGARRNLKEIVQFSIPIYLSRLIDMFGGNLQTILLGIVNTAATVGIFSVASQVNTVGKMFHGAVVTASSPIISELHDQGKREAMQRFYQTATKWTFTMNLPLFIIVLLFPKSILSIFGKDFIAGATALSILAWANMVNTGTGICGAVLDMTGNTVLKLVNSFVTVALTVGLNVFLIPRWGLMGAAVAALSATAAVNLLRLGEVFILLRMLPYNRSFIKPLTAGLVTLAAAGGVHSFSPAGVNLLYTALNVLILLIVYVSVILLLGLSQEDRMILSRVGRRMSAALSK